MKASTIKYFFSDAIKSLRRNKTISIASVATVAATLFILGVFMLTSINVNKGIQNVQSKFEAKIFLKDNISNKDKQAIYDKIQSTQGVKETTFESKEEALKNFKNQFKDNPKLYEGFDKANPLPCSYIVKMDKPEQISGLVKNVTGMSGVDNIQDGKEVLNTVNPIINVIKWVGVAMFVILIGVSLFLISNTIKLTVYARRKEIGIMKYIGATDWFIKWPFVIEGMILGFFGALLSTVVLYFGYGLVINSVVSNYKMIHLSGSAYVLNTIFWQFSLTGIGIGALGSILVIRKFLRV